MSSLRAQFEQRTLSLISLYLQQGDHPLVKESYLYALCHGVYPLFQEEIDDTQNLNAILGERPFYEQYAIPLKTVAGLADWLNSEWETGKTYGFAELEAFVKHGSNPHGITLSKGQLVHTLRYFYLQGTFSKPFWDGLGPGMESETVTAPFDPKADLPLVRPLH